MRKPQKEALCAAWDEKIEPRLSLASVADTAEILNIYAWYVENHIATFQITPPTLAEYEQWVADTLVRSPILLARDGEGTLLGFACAHAYHPREAFRWDMETTIYCARNARGLGVADALYAPLLEILAAEGYYNAYAVLSDPNPQSEAFHARYGFVCEGRCKRTGYKLGKWRGTSTWCLQLRKGNAAPEEIKRLSEAEQLAILEKYSV